MTVWIVFEYGEYVNKVIGVYLTEEQAKEVHKESPCYRYIEEYDVE